MAPAMKIEDAFFLFCAWIWQTDLGFNHHGFYPGHWKRPAGSLVFSKYLYGPPLEGRMRFQFASWLYHLSIEISEGGRRKGWTLRALEGLLNTTVKSWRDDLFLVTSAFITLAILLALR